LTVPEEWISRAQYDLDTARIVLEAGRHVYVLFFCQQAIEKKLKGIIVERTGKMPPRVHNLVALAETAGIAADEVRSDFLRALTDYYVETRYPEGLGGEGADVDRQLAEEYLGKTEDLLQWLTTFRKM